MTPDSILPAANMGAGLLCFACAMLLAYIANQAQNCLRAAFYGTLSLGATLSGAALIFGNLLCILVSR